MVTHECIVIITPGSTEELARAMESVQALITKHGGSVVASRAMGERTLAYPINKHRVGMYYCLDLSLPKEKVNTLSEAFNLAPSVIRAMMVRKEHSTPVASPAISVAPVVPVSAPVIPTAPTESVPSEPLSTEAKKKLDIDLGL